MINAHVVVHLEGTGDVGIVLAGHHQGELLGGGARRRVERKGDVGALGHLLIEQIVSHGVDVVKRRALVVRCKDGVGLRLIQREADCGRQARAHDAAIGIIDVGSVVCRGIRCRVPLPEHPAQ